MQLKTKYLMPVLTAVLMFGLSNSAFAQLSCSVASTPVSRDTLSGLTEVAGDLIFNCVGGGTATTQATITVSYPAVITDSTAYPAAKPIAIVSPAGFASGNPTIAGVNNATGQVTITLPAQAVPASSGFTLDGVLLALTGATAGSSMNANVSVSPGNGVLITAGQNVATVITSIQPGLKDPKLTSSTSSGVVLSSGITVTAGFSIDVTENYPDMFRTQNQFNTIGATSGATQATQVLLTFAGIPTGVTLGGCTVTDIVTGTATAVTLVGGQTTLTSTTNTAVVDITNQVLPAGMDLVNTNTLRFACTTFTAGSTATLPLAAGSITVQATLAPAGAALSSGGAVLVAATTGQIPRYTSTQQPTTPLPVITILPAQTNMLIPYVVINGAYDTGIALANTTADPFGGKATGSAVATGGAVQMSFYPQTGTACTLTTAVGSTSPAAFTTSPITGLGVGLDASGNLASGRTWTVLASSLLGAAPASAGCPSATAFTGYMFIIANSTDVHGSAFVSDFTRFTSYTNVLIVPTPATFPRSAIAIETLGN